MSDFFKNVEQGYSFDDVLLVPNYSELISRSEADIAGVPYGNYKFRTPIMSANMNTVTEGEMIKSMADLAGSGVLHRFMPVDKQIEIIRDLYENGYWGFGVSVGVNIDHDIAFRLIPLLNDLNNSITDTAFIVVDVAHGHHTLVKKTMEFLKAKFYGKVIAGNICTAKAAEDLIDWGADSIKIGVGPGAVCSTRIVTGCGYPQLSAIKNISDKVKQINDEKGLNVRVIADGGIKNSGDIVKALAAGADFVMVGSLLSGTKEAPGDVLTIGHNAQRKVKLYEGMASYDAQISYFKKDIDSITPEGVATFVDYKGSVENVINKLIGGIKSGFSYCGCKNLEELHEYGSLPDSWVKLTNAAYKESVPHILG